ncbi:MAG: protein kinase [Phycisphaerales bacterium]
MDEEPGNQGSFDMGDDPANGGGAAPTPGSGPGSRPRAKSGSERDLIEEALLEAERAARPPDLPPPDSFKGYEILGEIHRGGQGVVYQAIQLAAKRRVAIKVLHSGPFVGSAGRTRFEREVQVLGQLNHPNIVKIHDSGVTDSGSCFYVMDYISGSTLDEHISRDPKPEPRATLALFAKVCDAIAHAHLRGVIHRDLKPSNIRVDRSGEPIVVDFGLAKVALSDVGTDPDEPRVMTMTGEFIGSLPWASPEQAEGSGSAIDVRTDVYSLGVILYQMLTGRFPYAVIGNMRDVLENILKAEPARPSTVRRQINDEVETIVLKCLAKDRDRRYQSGAELARDVRRYLTGEPIEAKRDSVSYMLRKAVRRHKAAAAIVAIGLTALVVFGVSMWAMWREASSQRERAEANLASIRGIARTMIVEINDQIDDLRGATPAREALLTKARDLLSQMEGQASGDPGFLRDLADVHLRVADIHAGLYDPRVGGIDEAQTHVDRAGEVLRGLAGPDASAAATVELEARVHIARAELLHQRREFQQAADEFAVGIAAYDRLLAPQASGAAASALDIAAQNRVRDARMLARVRRADSLLRVPPGDEAQAAAIESEADATYDEAERYWEQRAAAAPSDLDAAQRHYILLDQRARTMVSAAMGAARAGTDPGVVAQAAASLDEARALAERARDGFERLAAARPQSADFQRDLYLADYFLGRTLLDEARLRASLPGDHAGALDETGTAAMRDAAMARFESALRTTERIFAADESNLQAQRDVAICLNQIGNTLRDMGRYPEAVVAFDRGLGIRRDVLRADPTPRHQSDLGVGLYKRAEVERLAALASGVAPAERRLRLQNAERLGVECVGVFQRLVDDGVLAPNSVEISDSSALLRSIRDDLQGTRAGGGLGG